MFYASGLFSTIVILTKRFSTNVILTKRQRVEGSRLYFPVPFPRFSG